MGKRQDAALETRQKIIDAVKELLEQKNPEEISIEEITKKAHVAKGSFYTHFKRKEDVISEIDFLEYDFLKNDVSHIQGVEKQLAYYLIQSVKIIKKNSLPIARQWMKGAVSPLEKESIGEKKYHYDYENILSILKKAINNKELKQSTPIEALTKTILNQYYGAVASWCILGQNYSLVEIIEHYCEDELNLLLHSYQYKEEN